MNQTLTKRVLFHEESALSRGYDSPDGCEFAEALIQDACVETAGTKRRRLDAKNADGMTPAFLALLGGHFQALKMLAELGADMNDCCGAGVSMVFVATVRGDARCLGVLIDAGADVNATDSDGISPAIVAYVKGDVKCLDMLIGAGAAYDYRRDITLFHYDKVERWISLYPGVDTADGDVRHWLGNAACESPMGERCGGASMFRPTLSACQPPPILAMLESKGGW